MIYPLRLVYQNLEAMENVPPVPDFSDDLIVSEITKSRQPSDFGCAWLKQADDVLGLYIHRGVYPRYFPLLKIPVQIQLSYQGAM
jgi:hypothetical protein